MQSHLGCSDVCPHFGCRVDILAWFCMTDWYWRLRVAHKDALASKVVEFSSMAMAATASSYDQYCPQLSALFHGGAYQNPYFLTASIFLVCFLLCIFPPCHKAAQDAADTVCCFSQRSPPLCSKDDAQRASTCVGLLSATQRHRRRQDEVKVLYSQSLPHSSLNTRHVAALDDISFFSFGFSPRLGVHSFRWQRIIMNHQWRSNDEVHTLAHWLWTGAPAQVHPNAFKHASESRCTICTMRTFQKGIV